MNSKLLFLSVLFTAWIVPVTFVTAQQYLVGIPGIDQPGLSFGTYINALYALSISIGALMAVIKIIIAGMKWMLSDIVTSKQEAIGEIRGSVLGLLVVVSAVVVLNQINPQLAETNIFLEKVAVPTPTTATSSPLATPVVQPGYSYVLAGPASASFSTACTAAGGLVSSGSLNGKPQTVCYEAVSQARKTWLASTFGNVPVTLERRFQMYHFPRERANNSIPPSTLPGGSTVVYAVNYSAPGNWIDATHQSQMVRTCQNFQQVLNQPVKIHGNLQLGYLACIRDTNNP